MSFFFHLNIINFTVVKREKMLYVAWACFRNDLTICFKTHGISFELLHDKTNVLLFGKDSVHPRHLSSVIRVLSVRKRKVLLIRSPLSAQRRPGGYQGCFKS